MKKYFYLLSIFLSLDLYAKDPEPIPSPSPSPSVRPASNVSPLGVFGAMAGVGPQFPFVSYDGRLIRDSLQEHFLSASVPVFKAETDSVAATLSSGVLRFDDRPFLSTGKRVSENLYRLEAGLQYSHRLPEMRAFGFRGSFGYMGDKINERTQSFNVGAHYSFPDSSKGMWVLMTMFSNNGPFGAFIPVPGFFYVYRTPTFTGIFGLPILSLFWTPEQSWSFSFSAFGPLLRTEAVYGTMGEFQVFAGAAWRQQRYLSSTRTVEDERLTIEEKTAELGFRNPILGKVFSELSAGYAFERRVYAGEKLFEKEGGSVDLKSSPYLKWSFRLVF